MTAKYSAFHINTPGDGLPSDRVIPSPGEYIYISVNIFICVLDMLVCVFEVLICVSDVFIYVFDVSYVCIF